MSTKAQKHNKPPGLSWGVTPNIKLGAFFALLPFQYALGLTAGERFHAMQNLNNNGGVMKSRWFSTAMLLILAGSIMALVIVSLYKKLRKGKKQKMEERGQKTEDRGRKTEDLKMPPPQVESSGQNLQIKTDIEKRISAIEERLTTLEQEVSSFEVIEDESNVIQASADTDGVTK